MEAYHTETIERDGQKYLVSHYVDDTARIPWEECDGEGIVSEWTSRAKMPGERVLASDRRSYRYYDIAATQAKAIEEGWDAEPYTGTRKQRAARAVEVNYQRLRAWCNGEWHYCGVAIRPVCPECGEAHGDEYQFALWGVESDCTDYLEEVAGQLIDECIATMKEESHAC